MEIDFVLTKNLTLTDVIEWDSDDDLISVELSFNFFGEYGQAHLLISQLESEYPTFVMTEIGEELSDSFDEIVWNDKEVWKKIVFCVREYHKLWIEENNK